MKTILILAAAAAASFAVPALAESGAFDSRTAAISFANLDLSSEAGIRELDRRIGAAARDACGTPSVADPKGRQKARACRADAIESAGEQRSRAIEAARR
jgi:UrcA family protein